MGHNVPSWAPLLGVWVVLALPAPTTAETTPQLAAAETAFAQGLFAFQEGDDATAIERFAEAARLNPNEGSPHYWRGLALLRLGRVREAAAAIAASLEARRPPEVDRERVVADLAAARQAAEGEKVEVEPPPWRDRGDAIDDRGLWEGSVGFAAAADSNPNLLSEELSLPAPGGGLVQGEEADNAASLGARLAVYPFHRRAGPILGVTLEASRSFHQDFEFLDLARARGAVQLAFGSDPLGYLSGASSQTRAPFGGSRFTALLHAGGTSYQLDGSSYLQTWEGAASLTFHETAATATRLDLGYADRDFSDRSDELRSGEDLSLQVSQLFFFGRRDRSLRLGVLTEDRRAEPEFAATVLEGNAEAAWPLGDRWVLGLEGSVREDDYEDPRSNLFDPTGESRNDTTARGAVTLAWAATQRLRWTARGAYIRRTSNVDLGPGLPDLDYRRLIVSAGMSWVF